MEINDFWPIHCQSHTNHSSTTQFSNSNQTTSVSNFSNNRANNRIIRPLIRVANTSTSTLPSSSSSGRTRHNNSFPTVNLLEVPRPHSQRPLNEYTETPVRTKKSSLTDQKLIENNKSNKIIENDKTIKEQPRKKIVPSKLCYDGSEAGRTVQNNCSIICTYCGKCRCDACQQPRALPERLILNNRCRCSSQTVLDSITCMCCAKAFFYHCSSENDDEVCDNDYDDDRHNDTNDNETATESCNYLNCFNFSSFRSSRSQPQRPRRHHQRSISHWLCLGILAVPLPCLLCYLPLKGLLHICEFGYSRLCFRSGCRCNRFNSIPVVPTNVPVPNTASFPTTSSKISNKTTNTVNDKVS